MPCTLDSGRDMHYGLLLVSKVTRSMRLQVCTLHARSAVRPGTRTDFAPWRRKQALLHAVVTAG